MAICVRPKLREALPSVQEIRQRAADVRRRWDARERQVRRHRALQLQFLLLTV